MASTAMRVLVSLALMSGLMTYVQAQNSQAINLNAVQSFCLRVTVQSSVAGVEGRSDELRRHLLRQATLYGVPVEDCVYSISLSRPVIHVVILAVSNGFAIWASVELDVFPLEEGVLFGVTIWDTVFLGTGSTRYERIRDEAQRVYEEIVTDWRSVTGR